jgi:hypothetical protein
MKMWVANMIGRGSGDINGSLTVDARTAARLYPITFSSVAIVACCPAAGACATD